MADVSESPMSFSLSPDIGEEQERQNLMIGVAVAMTTISLVCVGVRMYTRAFVVRNIGPGDWTMIAATIFTLVLMIEIVVGAKDFKLGFRAASMTTSDMQNNMKLTLAIIVVYKLVMTLIKISILLIYLQFAVGKTFQRLCKGTIYLLATYQTILIIIVPTQCRPLHKLWDFTGSVQGTCINANDFYSITSAFHIVMDIWILGLPIKMFLSIPRPPHEKLALCFVFSLGIFATICSIVRYHFLRQLIVSSDPFFATLPIDTWSMVEVGVAILCASLPTLRPLFSKAQRNRTKEALQKRPPPIPHVGRVISISAGSIKSDGRYSISTNSIGKEIEMGTFEMNAPPPVPPKDATLKDSMSINSSRSAALMDLERGDSFTSRDEQLTDTIHLQLKR